MSNGRWCTKQDVLLDLAKATGRKVTNIDNNYFIVGENPPPPLLFDDEESETLHPNDRSNYDNMIKPDLRGIAQMIRLVKEHSESRENIHNAKTCTSSPKTVCDIITISKLNPNVKEFIPKCTKLPVDDSNKDKVIDDSQVRTNCVNSVQTQISDCEPTEQVSKHINIENNVRPEDKLVNNMAMNENKDSKESDINNKTESESVDLKSNDTRAIATVLKNKISTFQKNTFHAKRERNVALSNLQKLYSVQPNPIDTFPAVQPIKKVIKLITPDFFEKYKAKDIPENEEITDHSDVHLIEEPVINNCQDSPIVKEKKGSLDNLETIDRSVRNIEEACSSDLTLSSAEIVGNSDIKGQNTITDSEKNNVEYNSANYDSSLKIKSNASDPQVQDSIKKVNNWLSKENKKSKGPIIAHLGPVSFKRKDVTNRQSPSEIEKKISKTTLTVTQQYVPTKYASELSKKYMERLKNKEIQAEKVSWENLNAKLKEKDAVMKTKSQCSSLGSSTTELSANGNASNS